jgi:hypothetical protein
MSKSRSGWSASDTASAVFNALRAHMDSDDRLLVIEVTGTATWQNELCDRQWLKNFLNS